MPTNRYAKQQTVRAVSDASAAAHRALQRSSADLHDMHEIYAVREGMMRRLGGGGGGAGGSSSEEQMMRESFPLPLPLFPWLSVSA